VDKAIATWALCFLLSTILLFMEGHIGLGMFSLVFLFAILKIGGD